MNLEETSAVIGVMALALPSLHNRNLKATAQIWQEIFANDDYKVVKAAVIKYLNYSKEWPTPAHIRQNIESIQPAADAVPSFDDAWGEVMGLIHANGYMHPPKPEQYSHAAVHDTVKNIGWLEICSSENIEATRAHFMRMYQNKRRVYIDKGKNLKTKQISDQSGASDKFLKLAEMVAANMGNKTRWIAGAVDDKKHPPEIHPNAQDESKVA